ncbi:MAG: sigma-70 family RNA polymerase sigma factor, partial [Acidobacteriota bacterium]
RGQSRFSSSPSLARSKNRPGESPGLDAGSFNPDLEESFDRLYRRHYPGLVVFFGRRGLDPERSRDLAQEVMVRAYRGLAGFEARAIEKAQLVWLRRIAVHVWANWLRAKNATSKRSGKEQSLEQAQETGFEPSAEHGIWQQQGDDPEKRTIEAEAREQVEALLVGLPKRQRECLELWLNGAAYQDISLQLDISLQTVRSSLHKAKKRVLTLWQGRHPGGP